MSWKESKVRVLTHQGGLQGLQVLSTENKKSTDQDVFLLQPSNSSNAVPAHSQTSLPATLPTSSSHSSLAAVKFKIPLPPSPSPSSILQHHQQQQQRQHLENNKSLMIHNLPSDVSCVPIISSNASQSMHQFQIQQKPPSISTLLRHQPLPLSGHVPNQQSHPLEASRNLHPISNYNPVNTSGIKTEHQNIIELSQAVCNQLPRSTTLTPALCMQPSQHPLKEESSATLTLSSLLPASLSIIPTSSANLNQSSTRLHSPSLSSHQTSLIETIDASCESAICTELMPPPPPPQLPSHSRNTPSPSTNVSSTSEEDHERAIEFDGNDQVLCRVCGDKASGFHYGVHSCEGCKGFFRRSIQQKIQYRPCTKNQQCNILRINRNRCQYCRLKKCIAAGMSRDAVRFGRVPKREKAKILAAMQSSRQKTQESKIMTEMNDDSKIIETIVRAHYDTCDYTRNKIEPFIQKSKTNPSYISCTGSTCPMKGRSDDTFHEQFSERFMDHVRQVCTFAKLIPGFKCLHHDDQVTLLKSCVFEVLLVRLAGLFDSQALICLNGDLIRRETITHMPPGNAKFLMDSVFGLAIRMNQFGLSDAEIGLFCAVVIITADRPGLRNPELVHKMQSKLKSVLSNILLPQHPEHATMFSELMTMVHDLRTLNTLHTEKFLQQFKFGGGSSSSDAAVTQANQDGGSSDEGSQGSTDSNPTTKIGGQKKAWVGNEQDSTGNESPQSYTDTTSTGSAEDGCMNRRSPGMGSVSSSESVRSTEILKLTTNDLKVTGSALLNALAAPTSVSSIAIAAAEVAANNPYLAASTRSPSSSTLCPIMSRRREVDPSLCPEFSASKNVDSQKIEQQFMINNLKLLPLQQTMSETGSSSSAVAIPNNKSSTRTPSSAMAASSCTIQQSEAGGSKYKTQTRKLDSPGDSGIDSPKGAQGSTHSTNTSVCSSPINDEDKTSNNNLLTTSNSSEEEIKKEAVEPVSSHKRIDTPSMEISPQCSTSGGERLEEHQHPLLKRALEQPPQSFNPIMGGVTTFRDEVYKPHKKFRRSNIPPSANIDDYPSSTQSGCSEDRLSSPPPSSSHHQTSNLLATQLAEAPKNYERRSRSPPQEQPISLLASTLRRETPLSTPEEAERRELLANLILEGNVPSLCPMDPEHQGLLMCATGRQDAAYSHQIVNKANSTNTSNLYNTSTSSQEKNNATGCIPRRQLPAPVATITSQTTKSEPITDYRSSPAVSGSYCPYSSDASLDVGTRHIPVQQAPTKPHHHHSQSVILGVSSSRSAVSSGTGITITPTKDTPPHPEELSKLHSLAEAAASLSAVETSGANDGNSSTTTVLDSQPLNLSTSRSSPTKQNVPTEA